MNDTEEIRTVLVDATALRGDVRVRGTATRSVRQRARQRRATAAGAGAAALAICVVVGLLALTSGGGPGRTAVPAASSRSTTPAPSPPELPHVAPGAHTLASAIEIRPVRAEDPGCTQSSPAVRTVPAAYGPACYRLGQPWLVLHRLDGIDVSFASDENGLVSENNGQLVLKMTPDDRATFGQRTTQSIGQRIALVADGRVWLAPVIGSPIPSGQLYLDLPVVRLRSLLEVLGVPASSTDEPRVCSDRPPGAGAGSMWKPGVACLPEAQPR